MTKVTQRMPIKEGTTIKDVMKNGTAQQRKIACIFDANSDGKLTGNEVKLFNSTSTKENSDGSIDFWTILSSGKKIKNTVSKDNLMSTVLTADGMKETHSKKITKNGKLYNVHYTQSNIKTKERDEIKDKFEPGEEWKLASTDPKTGEKKYICTDEEYYNRDDGSVRTVKYQRYIKTDVYGHVREIKAADPTVEEYVITNVENGYAKKETFYKFSGEKIGAIEKLPDGKEKITDGNGKVLYYYKVDKSHSTTTYYDANGIPKYQDYHDPLDHSDYEFWRITLDKDGKEISRTEGYHSANGATSFSDQICSLEELSSSFMPYGSEEPWQLK